MLTMDFETRSVANLKATGMYRYAEDPSTEIMCLSVKPDNEPTVLWVPEEKLHLLTEGHGLPLIADEILAELLLDHRRFDAHNAGFERVIWTNLMVSRGFAQIPISRWSCTAARAATCNLPRHLAGVGSVLNLSIQKDDVGSKVMLKMCKPRRLRSKPGVHWNEEPHDFLVLCRYCIQDTEAEYQLGLVLPELLPQERAVWELDQLINDRGLRLDIQAIRDLEEVVAKYERGLTHELQSLTAGVVTTAKQVAKLKAWLATRGCDLPDLAKSTVEQALKGALRPEARRALEIRQKASKASTAKLRSMQACSGSDCRVRGTLLYHGASTGRWSGKLIQPHNFPRGALTTGEVDNAIWFLQNTGACPTPLGRDDLDCQASIVSSCLRGLITAGPGAELICADFSNIEGRGAAWLANETWKVDAFRAYDTRSGPDLYKLAYSRSFNVPVEKVTKDQRQIGKAQELALGYQGGIGAFGSMAKQYKMDLSEVAEAILSQPIEENEYRRAKDLAEDFLKTHPEKMNMKEAVACDIIKQRWRSAHDSIVQTWRGLQYCAVTTIERRSPYRYGKVIFNIEGRFMTIQLPSGRKLYYCDPLVKIEENKWGQKVKTLRYHGVNSLTKKWQRTHIYGGLIFENIIQAIARDVMAEAMLRVNQAGYPVIMTVHDEVVAEVQEGTGSQAQFDSLMAVVPDWAAGLPVAVAGWRGYRYRKD